MRSHCVSLSIPLVLLLIAPAQGRLIPFWPYERLFREADVSVIAAAQFSEATADASPDSPPPGERFAGLNTTLEVQQVLKGTVKNRTFQLLHFKWNRFHITMKGDRLTVVLNGKTVIENAQLPGIAPRGPIALQHHGDRVQFANIFVRELK